jgi:hypothetical protein
VFDNPALLQVNPEYSYRVFSVLADVDHQLVMSPIRNCPAASIVKKSVFPGLK